MGGPVDELLRCPCCLELFTDPHQLPCGHRFCLDCLDGVQCLTCSAPYYRQDVMRSTIVASALPKYRAYLPELTRRPRGLRWVLTGYAYRPPALGTHRRRRAACPQGPLVLYVLGARTSLGRSVAYQPRAFGTYRVPWHPR